MRSLILLFLILPVISSGEFDFTVDVPAGKFQCYFQPIDNSKHKSMEVDYQVIDGGDLNINVMILNGAEVMAKDHMKTDGSHKVEIKQTGDYQICFDNSFSYQSRKVVFFEIFLFDELGNLDDIDAARLGLKDEALSARMEQLGVTISDFHTSASKIKGELNKIEYYQAVLRAQEARDRSIMNANFDRVTFWSLINAMVLIGVGGIQVFVIRSLFEENSKVGRFLRKGARQD